VKEFQYSKSELQATNKFVLSPLTKEKGKPKKIKIYGPIFPSSLENKNHLSKKFIDLSSR